MVSNSCDVHPEWRKMCGARPFIESFKKNYKFRIFRTDQKEHGDLEAWEGTTVELNGCEQSLKSGRFQWLENR